MAEVARLAKVSPERQDRFTGEVFWLLVGAWQSSEFRLTARERKSDALLKKAESGARAAYAALRALSPPQRDVFERAFLVAGCCRELLNADVEAPAGLGLGVLEAMVEAFACITGKSPTFEARGHGRPKKTPNDWQFRTLVGVLWQTVNKYGGELTFSCNANKASGTMVDALNALRPLLPRLIPLALDQKAKTIARIKRTLRTEAYERFAFMSSASTTRMPF
jgi:hypothetical protein